MLEIVVEIKNQEGLHARPASEFSKAAMKYKSEIKVFKNREEKAHNPKNILSFMSMGAVKGDVLRVMVSGDDEALAMEELRMILESLEK